MATSIARTDLTPDILTLESPWNYVIKSKLLSVEAWSSESDDFEHLVVGI
jgi:hypothetical protein